MFVLIFFLIAVSLMLAVFPELPTVVTLLVPLVPLVLVGMGRLALFLSSRGKPK